MTEVDVLNEALPFIKRRDELRIETQINEAKLRLLCRVMEDGIEGQKMWMVTPETLERALRHNHMI